MNKKTGASAESKVDVEATRPEGDRDAVEEKSRRTTHVIEKTCQWLVDRLDQTGRVTHAEFKKYFARGLDPDQAVPFEASDWTRARQGVAGSLRALGVQVTHNSKEILIPSLDEQSLRITERSVRTKFFDPHHEQDRKAKIGALVAEYLWYLNDRHILLGSGTTVFHVARAMTQVVAREKQLYPQLFWTINIAVASYFCESEKRPLSRIQIPEGHLRTSKYRFESMQRPDWSVPVAVIGADGCFYDYSRDSAILYANDRTVADNTNIFFRGATDSVICCISSTKLTDNPKQGQNSGPPIDSPNVHRNTAVKCYLVTDDVENGENRKIKALKNQGWRIVTKLHDWPQFDRFKPPHWGSQSANS